MKLLLLFVSLVFAVHAKNPPPECVVLNLKKRAGITKADEERKIDRIYDYSGALEKLINQQIKFELNAFYAYLSMSHFFHRDDYYMEGFAKFFHESAMEEFKHAEMFMKYQAKRGGRVELMQISKPIKQTWDSAYQVFNAAFELEKKVTTKIRCLSHLANEEYSDIDLAQFLDGEILPEQYSSMKELMNHMSTLQRTSSVEDKSHQSSNNGDIKNSNAGIAEVLLDNRLKS